MKGSCGLIIGGVFSLLPLLLYGQDKAVKGRILDAVNNEPLIGAHIMLQSNWRIGTATNLEGDFTLDISTATAVDSIIISFVGYIERVVAIRDLESRHSILLNEQLNAMQDIEIVGERLIAEEFSVQKIQRLDIYKNPSAKADVLLAVNTMPSSTTVDETANVSFRGSSPIQTGIFFNQVPVYDAVRFSQLNGIGTFSFFNTDIVNNVQVFASNPPLEFGNTTSGLVAIQSEDQLVSHRTTSVLLSMAGLGLNHRQRIGRRSSLALFGNYQFSAPLKSVNKASLEDIRSFTSIDGGIHFVYHSPKKLSFKIFHYSLKEGYDYNFRSPSYSGLFQQSRFNSLSIVNVVKRFESGSLSINMGNRLSYQRFAYSKAEYDIENQDYYGSIQYHLEKPQWGVKAGIAYDGRFQQFQGVVPTYYFAQGLQDPFEVVNPTPVQREVLDLFLYYKYIPRDGLTFGVAVRKNVPWNKQDHYLSRQFNIDYRFHRWHNLKLAVGTFNQYVLPRETEDPALLRTQQLSLDHQYRKENMVLSTSLFYKRTNFQVDRIERIAGLEISLSYHLASIIVIDLSYTGLEVSSEVEGERFPSLYDLTYFVRLGVEWNITSTYTLGLRGLFRDGTYYQPLVGTIYRPEPDAYEPIYSSLSTSVRYPGYNLLDVSISSLYPLGDKAGLVVFISAGNIFNFRNIRSYSYNRDYTVRTDVYFSQRTIYLGGVISF